MSKNEILRTAESLISGDRNDDYGDYAKESERLAKVWSVILGVPVEPHRVPLCMIALKLVRQSNKHKKDNLVDMAGYAALAMDVHESSFRGDDYDMTQATEDFHHAQFGEAD